MYVWEYVCVYCVFGNNNFYTLKLGVNFSYAWFMIKLFSLKSCKRYEVNSNYILMIGLEQNILTPSIRSCSSHSYYIMYLVVLFPKLLSLCLPLPTE